MEAPVFRIVLVEPEIPPNTGNVIRLAANTGCELHLVEPLGFAMTDPLLRRAGLDYHEYVDVRRHASWDAFVAASGAAAARTFAFTSETSSVASSGVDDCGPAEIIDHAPSGRLYLDGDLLIPSTDGTVQTRKKLSFAGHVVAVVVFEAWRQNGYAGGA